MDDVKVTGHVKYVMTDPDGTVVSEWECKNLVVTVGKNFLATWLAAASQAGAFMQYFALGTGTNAPTAADTTLQTELSTRVAGTISSSNNVLQNQAVFAAGVNTGAITEAGLFSASSSGTMFCRQTFAVQNKLAANTLTATWSITFS